MTAAAQCPGTGQRRGCGGQFGSTPQGIVPVVVKEPTGQVKESVGRSTALRPGTELRVVVVVSYRRSPSGHSVVNSVGRRPSLVSSPFNDPPLTTTAAHSPYSSCTGAGGAPSSR